MATINGSFTGTGTSSFVNGVSVDISISGTFVGTVEIQRLLSSGTWGAVETITGEAERVAENARSRSVRLECTAYTSGTINYELSSNA